MGNVASVGQLAEASIVVNFMCQLDWTTSCQDIWLNVILGVPERVFLEESHI